jgi:4-amino-4-deoxy-L-arabinose transferase-like glycosyltransferase
MKIAAVANADRALVDGWPASRALLYISAGLLLFLLCLPLFTADRAPINSDQSLYLSEAQNIAQGNGLTYATGEPIVHRSPLYPAFLAGALKLAGGSLDGAYLVPRLATVANVFLIAALAWMLFGGWAGIAAGLSAASSVYLRGLGTTLFLDSTQVTFLLAALAVYWQAYRTQSLALSAAAGGLLGASFLIKEASVLFVPLPVVVLLLFGFPEGWKRSLVGWFAGFAVTTAWWWAWVFVQTDRLFLAGPADGRLGLAVSLAAIAGATVVLAALRFGPRAIAASATTRALAALLLLAWNVLFFVGLDQTGWVYDSNYLANVPAYVADIFVPNVQPGVLVLAAWGWAIWAAVRGNRAAGLAVVSLLLYASFFVIVADRGLSLRDQLPVVLLSYLVLGGAVAALVEAGKGIDLGSTVRDLGGAGSVAAAMVLVAVVAGNGTSIYQAGVTNLQDDWQNPLSAETAAWLSENVEPGATILSSRLYYSQLHFLTDAEYEIHQLPTVEVTANLEAGAATPLSRRSTLFRWEQHLMPADSPSDRWLYLTRYPVKGYLIGMAEDDLLLELRRRDAQYVVISTFDAGFSSPSFNRYFEDNPAFELLTVIGATPADEARIYRVDAPKLAPQERPAQVTRSAAEYMDQLIGDEAKATEYLERLNPAGYELVDR